MSSASPSLPDAFIRDFAALPARPARAIIINCSTMAVSTLALMSALRHAGMPVVLIDCESTDGSLAWFKALQAHHDFTLLQAPLRPHGEALDAIFRASRDESLLLIDSDLEIQKDDLMPALHAAMSTPGTYGAGFLHSDRALTLGAATGEKGRYADRMWIPLAFLKVAPVQAALAAGATFMHSRDYLEFPWSTSVARILYQRHRVPLLKHISLAGLADIRERRHGERAAFREYDTGARVHEALLAGGHTLADLGEPYLSQSLTHYHGVTRATLTEGKENATAPSAIRAEVVKRLGQVYGVVLPDAAPSF